MTRDELNQALLRHGADLERWPERERKAARLLLSADARAAKLLTDFAAFERTLAAAVRPDPFGAAEIGKVLAHLDTTEAGWRPSPRFWIASAGISALSFAAGFGAVVLVSWQELPPSLVDLASGQMNFGGLL